MHGEHQAGECQVWLRGDDWRNGYACADEQGKLASTSVLEEGYQQLARIIKESKEIGCKGVFYWEPECKPSQYKLGAFTEDGRPTRIMDAFKE